MNITTNITLYNNIALVVTNSYVSIIIFAKISEKRLDSSSNDLLHYLKK